MKFSWIVSSRLLGGVATSNRWCRSFSTLQQPLHQRQRQQKQQQQGEVWKPRVANLEDRRRLFLRGLKHDSEVIGSLGFHHVEFYCGDAKMAANQLSLALGMPVVGITGQSTGNARCASYALASGGVRFLLTAPYARSTAAARVSDDDTVDNNDTAPDPLPNYSPGMAHEFFAKHGFAGRAVGLRVRDAGVAFEASVSRGAKPILRPTFVPTCPGQINDDSDLTAPTPSPCYVAEVQLYGDVVLRYVSFPESSSANNHDSTSTTTRPQPSTMNTSETDTRPVAPPFLPHLAPAKGKMAERKTFGLYGIDHAVGNVPNLLEALNRITKFTGFHEFAEFTSEDVGTVDSGLNAVVLASDTEDVLLPLNEPTEGKRKSQIQTYLEQNEGPGLQHLALKTTDIFETITAIRRNEEEFGGGLLLELMQRPSDQYYRELPDRLGDRLTPEQYERLEELGILADADDEGILLQVFTKPVGDRPTFFFEIIQRVGCMYTPAEEGEREEDRPSDEYVAAVVQEAVEKRQQRSGCGGFGQGNFRELFKAVEEHEKTLKV